MAFIVTDRAAKTVPAAIYTATTAVDATTVSVTLKKVGGNKTMA